VEGKKRIIVGMNQFTTDDPFVCKLLKVTTEVENLQKSKLKKLKEERDNARVTQALGVLKQAAEGTANLMPPVVDAVRAYATLGEIADVLRGVFGEYRER
jgi:methylmalonyl-CoA mutase N-terminal domain/subunit